MQYSHKLSGTYLNQNKFLSLTLAVCAMLVMLGIFQDFLHSMRNDHPFYFSESLLFKVFWIVFPPILIVLKSALDKYHLQSPFHYFLAILIPCVIHLIIVPLAIWGLSTIFREQAYGVIKVFTYTASNDLAKLLLIYGTFVLMLSYLKIKNKIEPTAAGHALAQHLVLTSGKNNTRIAFKDICFIEAATPYVAIKTESKQHLQNTTLKSIIKLLDARFIRVHKSYIVNVEYVSYYKSRLNGDYDIELVNEHTIRLSRNYVSEFKKRIKSNTHLK